MEAQPLPYDPPSKPVIGTRRPTLSQSTQNATPVVETTLSATTTTTPASPLTTPTTPAPTPTLSPTPTPTTSPTASKTTTTTTTTSTKTSTCSPSLPRRFSVDHFDYEWDECLDSPPRETVQKPVVTSEWVTLNVGGQIFQTSRSTLLSDKSSMLAHLISSPLRSSTDPGGTLSFFPCSTFLMRLIVRRNPNR